MVKSISFSVDLEDGSKHNYDGNSTTEALAVLEVAIDAGTGPFVRAISANCVAEDKDGQVRAFSQHLSIDNAGSAALQDLHRQVEAGSLSLAEPGAIEDKAAVRARAHVLAVANDLRSWIQENAA